MHEQELPNQQETTIHHLPEVSADTSIILILFIALRFTTLMHLRPQSAHISMVSRGQNKQLYSTVKYQALSLRVWACETTARDPLLEYKAMDVPEEKKKEHRTPVNIQQNNSVRKNGCCSELRLRTVLYAVFTACIMAFLMGTTIAYSSLALLQLTQLQDPQLRFDTRLADIFGVSVLVVQVYIGE